MERINFTSPEWLTIKRMLEEELDLCVKNLINPGLTESEYHQWRGRAALANKLLGLDFHSQQVTE